jgi:ribosomal protein L29
MALKTGDINGMNDTQLAARLKDLELELLAGAGSKVSSIRLSIARIKTAQAAREKKGKAAPVKKAAPAKAATAPAKKPK